MQRNIFHRSYTLAFLCVGFIVCGPALAEKPAQAGGGQSMNQGKDVRNAGHNGDNKGRGESHGQDDRNAGRNGDNSGVAGDASHRGGGSGVTLRFDDRQRTVIRDYYTQQIRSGHCPPGLAKKNNGCMPPGQAKKWAIGQSLPRDVVFYDLSPEIVIHLGPPPSMHRYVRVASDILLIAVGTGMVIDAIEDLSNL